MKTEAGNSLGLFFVENMTDGKKIEYSIQQVKPKFYAQKCPTCNGFGTLKYGTIKCNGCHGKTWVLVPIEMDGETKNGRT